MEPAIRLNDKETDRFATSDMIFDAATYIPEVSKYRTIEPGDARWMGTDGPPRNMKPGDRGEIEIGGIGMLRIRVVVAEKRGRESPRASTGCIKHGAFFLSLS